MESAQDAVARVIHLLVIPAVGRPICRHPLKGLRGLEVHPKIVELLHLVHGDQMSIVPVYWIPVPVLSRPYRVETAEMRNILPIAPLRLVVCQTLEKIAKYGKAALQNE